MKKLYLRERSKEIKKSSEFINSEVYQESDIASLPEPVKRFFRLCGYINKPKVVNADVIWKESYIKLSPDKDWTELKTIQFNSVINPVRIAYMKALSMPLEVRDIYKDGQGHMYGKLFNLVPVLNAKGKEISQSSLITLFTEILFIPGYSLQDYIVWEEVDSFKAKARFIHRGIDVTGDFYFDETGRFIRFETDDRYYKEEDGKFVKRKFSAVVSSYSSKNGLLIPKNVKIIWHFDEGDYEYFKGEIQEVVYNIKV